MSRQRQWGIDWAAAILFLWASALQAGETSSGFEADRLQRGLAARLDLTRWQTDAGFDKVVTVPSGAGNAAVDYARVETLFAGDFDSAEGVVKVAGKGLEAILAATRKRECDLVPAYLKPMVDQHTPAPNGKVFLHYVDALKRSAASLEERGQFAAAVRALESIVIMGWHFTEDRPSVVTYSLGLTIQAHGCNELEGFWMRQLDIKRGRQCREYKTTLRKVMQDVTFKARFLLGKWDQFASLEACRRVVMEDEELVWRQEAALNLGAMQNGWPRQSFADWAKDPVQQRVAREALQHMADQDAAESGRKLAAWCLENMTIDRIREWRGARMLPAASDADTAEEKTR